MYTFYRIIFYKLLSGSKLELNRQYHKYFCHFFVFFINNNAKTKEAINFIKNRYICEESVNI